jgi:HK97 family phage prohead protease
MNNYYENYIERKMLPQSKGVFDFQVKSLQEDGIFAGYASVFGVLDSQSDIIEQGAFKASITNRTHEIKLLWQHDMREPIGVITTLKEDRLGLYIEGRLLVSQVARAAEAYALIKSGVVQGLSIGYSPVRFRYDEQKRIRHISQVDLWEVSLVTFPANAAAQITVIKSNDISTNQLRNLHIALDKALKSLSVFN